MILHLQHVNVKLTFCSGNSLNHPGTLRFHCLKLLLKFNPVDLLLLKQFLQITNSYKLKSWICNTICKSLAIPKEANLIYSNSANKQQVFAFGVGGLKCRLAYLFWYTVFNIPVTLTQNPHFHLRNVDKTKLWTCFLYCGESVSYINKERQK